MVLLVQRLSRSLKPSFKLENHHHHHHHHHGQEVFSASLHAFEDEISKGLLQLSLQSKPSSEILTLPWIRQCLQLLPTTKKAFAKLVADIDYPISSWELASVEGYLADSLRLLELLNSITSCLSHLAQARMAISHALSLMEDSPAAAMERLKAIRSFDFNKNHKHGEENEDNGQERYCSGKDWIIHQALAMIKSVVFSLCGVVAVSLCGDVQACLEIRKAAGEFGNFSLISSDLKVCEEIIKSGSMLREVRDVNEGVGQLIVAIGSGQSSNAEKELQRRVEVLGKLLEGVGEEVDQLFSEVLMGRNDLLNSL
ncbi:PREDICTED: protein BPS1, chloroplastic-like [Nelumbo nucifera]|uniref:Protein BPS1, chloroplastic-like n=1 Tax=Nelumbo nucifera TaxID=4432 RepID=A0A1U8ATM7_NELNU|nr:PREDICTED: protein BPS1, chloroplastic-like [Nelumbo nucifera]